MDWKNRRCALVVGHPGHELRVWGWVERTKPLALILTDGSGGVGSPRITSSRRILTSAGAKCGDLFGALSDRRLYQDILQGEYSSIFDILESLVDQLDQARIDFVAGDAVEGFNPTHDLCRLLINAAVMILRRRTGKAIENYEFFLVQNLPIFAKGESGIGIDLSAEELERKIEIARTYSELTGEVDKALSGGTEFFQRETLRPVRGELSLDYPQVPYYEQYGAERIQSGLYHELLTYRRHMLPLVEALQRHSERRAA